MVEFNLGREKSVKNQGIPYCLESGKPDLYALGNSSCGRKQVV